jgi:Mrp family chromosome partitioning ATPase
MELLAPREVKDESDLADAYPLPILARIPFVQPGMRGGDRRATRSRAAIREGFRSLRGRLEYRGGTNPVGDAGDGRRPAGVGILFTSGSRGDGRTSSALNLAYVAAGAGQSVIVIDLDFPNPEAAELLGAEPEHDLRRLLADHARIDDALTEVPLIPGVQVLAAPPDPDLLTAERLNRRVGWIIAEARKEADWVIVDAPPLGGESDALAAVEAVDDVVVVARLGRTRQAGLLHLRDLLEPVGTAPAGYLVIGRAPLRYYGYPGREG